jgi:SAM-dependent methyltransferase
MKENKYDNDIFFEKYSCFPRSVEGLNGAGEWHELKKLLPDFNGKRVLDIGCGFGWHCIYAAGQGAAYVLGIDISEKMLAVAKAKTTFHNVDYKQMAMEDMAFPQDEFDVIVSSLAFHYTPDFKDICQRIGHCLSSGGYFIFSVEHPVFTAYGTQDWWYDDNGNRDHWPVDNYFYEGKRDAIFLGEHIIKYHKTLATYLNSLLQTGFTITGLVEPQPAKHLSDNISEMRDELRRPMMLLVSAKKL